MVISRQKRAPSKERKNLVYEVHLGGDNCRVATVSTQQLHKQNDYLLLCVRVLHTAKNMQTRKKTQQATNIHYILALNKEAYPHFGKEG